MDIQSNYWIVPEYIFHRLFSLASESQKVLCCEFAAVFSQKRCTL